MASVSDLASDGRDLLTYSEAARRIGCPVSTLYALVSQRRIPHIRIGPRFVRFDAHDLDEWVRAHRVEPGEGAGDRTGR